VPEKWEKKGQIWKNLKKVVNFVVSVFIFFFYTNLTTNIVKFDPYFCVFQKPQKRGFWKGYIFGLFVSHLCFSIKLFIKTTKIF
jgi:hypothetical protein